MKMILFFTSCKILEMKFIDLQLQHTGKKGQNEHVQYLMN